VVKRVTIKKKQWFSEDTFGLEVLFSGIDPQPGQFLQVRVNTTHDPFLNRPISVASYKEDRLLLIIRVVGRGTEILSRKEAGEELDVLGPFGKEIKLRRKKSLLIAGGIGVAPLLFLAQKMHGKRIEFDFIYGVKREQDLIKKNHISNIARRAIFVYEEGKGKMTALDALTRVDIRSYDIAYACGPKAMLMNLQELKLPMPTYAFCEDFLGCGCGLCLGCAIMYKGEYKRICEDGPVFELKEIEFNK
jgi:dihydroorotate dehydrogenase electron transfer subunit